MIYRGKGNDRKELMRRDEVYGKEVQRREDKKVRKRKGTK